MNYKYCPSCGAEYRAKFNICADCQVALSPEPSADAKLDDEPAGAVEYSARSLISVFETGRRSDAEMARGFLEAQGVEAEVWSAGLAPADADFGASRVMVPEDQVEEARTLLTSVDEGEPILDEGEPIFDEMEPMSKEDSFIQVDAYDDAAGPVEENSERLDSALDFLRQRWAVLAFALAVLLIILFIEAPG